MEMRAVQQDETKQGERSNNFDIKIDFHKSSIIKGIIVLAVMLTFSIYAGISAWPAFGGAMVYFVIKNLKIHFPEHRNPLWIGIEITLSGLMTEKLVQYLLLDAELRMEMTPYYTRVNVLCSIVFYFLMLLITARPKIACIIGHTALMVLAGINYFVYQFRGNEFNFGDLKAASTGLSVASKYTFVLNDRAVYVIILSILYVALIRKLDFKIKRKWMLRMSALMAAAVLALDVAVKTEDTVMESWEQKGTYRNGYILNFALSIRDSIITKPHGYKEEAIASLEEQYPSNENTGKEKDPTIIVVMNESFADLNAVAAYPVSMTEDPLPFYHSMQDNVMKGNALSSVFGAKTPDSEWEFLTGNTMAFLPDGSVPYQQYMSEKPYSLVSVLKERGYTCKAMHPYYETGWSRNKIYPLLGFEEMMFLDDFDQTNLMREYVPDQVLYDSIIDQYEAKGTDEKLFIMSVTMQNHGGYTERYDNFKNTISADKLHFADVNQYLTLIHESDKALENLITYFESVDEPVEIVFFGDHQPGLNQWFYQAMNGKGMSGLTLNELEAFFTVPFFIWTNYEMPSETVERTSLNYLSTMALERAGIPLPPYNEFLSDTMEEIPAMNAKAYYSKEEGGFRYFDEAEGKEAEALEKYHILQYNNMFEEENSQHFFPYYEELKER